MLKPIVNPKNFGGLRDGLERLQNWRLTMCSSKADKREIVVTVTPCALIEDVRLGLEVLLGGGVRFKDYTVERGYVGVHGTVHVGGKEQKFSTNQFASDIVILYLPGLQSGSLGIFFNKKGTVAVHDFFPAGQRASMAWVGSSYTDRQRHPLATLENIFDTL